MYHGHAAAALSTAACAGILALAGGFARDTTTLASETVGTPTSVFSQDTPPAPPQERIPPEEITAGTLCSECHGELNSKKVVHRPVRWENCKICHIQADPKLHVFTDPKDVGAVCIECHVLPERASTHAPVTTGECYACHLPHQSDHRYLLKSQVEVELCVNCHADQVGVDKKYVHGPAAAGACSLCHMPHSSNEPGLLRTSGSVACMDCHEDMRAKLAPPNSVHAPVQEDCAQCHDPHASDHRYQLRTDRQALCLDCHRPMIEKLESQPVYHEALCTEEGCAHCHDVHSSPYPNMLKSTVKDLCLSCHTQEIERPDGTKLAGMGDKLDKSKFLHGPIKDGNCEACHDPHGSVTFSLLREPYPQGFYAPFKPETYALCFGCHDSKSFLTAETENLTEFRNGATNLHHLHVSDVTKGRSCRACHETHASDRPKHVTEAVPFGTWDIPLNFEKTETGGSCAPGCHTPKAYDRITPPEIAGGIPTPGDPPPQDGQ